RWAYPQPLVDVSFDEHLSLAELHGGAERWGFRFVNCGSWEGRGEDISESTVGESSMQDNLAGRRRSLEKTLGLEDGKPSAKKNRRSKDTGFPSDLNWMHSELTDSYTSMAPSGETAQVHPYLFTQSMLSLAEERGAKFLPSTKAISITKSSDGHVTGVDCIRMHSPSTSDDNLESKAETQTENIHLEATHVVLAAGAWAVQILSTLPLTGTRAHSITIHPPSHFLPISPYVLFTEIQLPSSIKRSKVHTSPEIYARPGPEGEIYACGPGDDSPLPNSVDDVTMDPHACQNIWEEVCSVSKVLRAGRIDRQQGICNAPGTAKSITQLIMEGEI
ncbi:hypothetical protein H0H93_013830, partial [Arthromyces matolae]